MGGRCDTALRGILFFFFFFFLVVRILMREPQEGIFVSENVRVIETFVVNITLLLQ